MQPPAVNRITDNCTTTTVLFLQLIEKIVEATDTHRQQLIHLLVVLVREGKIFPNDLNREVFSVVGFMQDMEADIPYVYENVAEMVAPLIRSEGEVYISYINFEREVRVALPEGDPRNEALFVRYVH